MRKLALLLCLCVVAPCMAIPTRADGGLDQRLSELSGQIAGKMTAKQKTTVAVVEFTDLQGNTTDFGRFLAEELVTRLMETEKFRVIERQLLNKIIAEQKLSLSGVIDPASAKQLGKILGVDAIVSGTVTNLSQSLKVNARLISTETGEIFAVASAEIFKDESVTGLLVNGGGGAAPAPTPKPTPQAAAAGNTPPQRVKGFVFELRSCKLVGDSVFCYLSVKNELAEDRELRIKAGKGWTGPSSRLFDEFGNEYVASDAWLGSQGGSGYAYNTLVSQVPTRVTIKFENVLAQASKVTLSLLVEPPDSSDYLALTFRNISVTK